MKKCLSLFVVGVLFGLISCRINCPDFDKKILSWIPYQEKDVIELYSQSKDSTIIFSIKDVVIDHTTYYHGKCACGDYISIRGHDKSDFQIFISSEGNFIHSQSYQIGDTEFNDNDTYTEIKDFLFESIKYDIVRIFEKNNSKETYKKLIIAKDIGII